MRVVDHHGEPVPDARVTLASPRSGEQLAHASGTLELGAAALERTTDASGRVRLPLPVAREAELSVEVGDGRWWSGRRAIPPAGEPLRIELPEPRTLRGVCLDEGEHPSWNATVEVTQLGGRVRYQAQTDAEGAFAIDGIMPGEYLLAALEERGRASVRYEGIEVSATPLRLVLREMHSMLGQVVAPGEPVGGLRVTLVLSRALPAESRFRETTTDSLGRFVFAGLEVRTGGHVAVWRAGDRQPSIVTLARANRDPVWCVLEPRGLDAPVEIEIESGLRGPAALVELRNRRKGNSLFLTPTEDAGRFRSPAVPLAAYAVVAWVPELGAIELGGIKPREGRFPARSFRVHEPGRVELELVTGGDPVPEGVEVALLAESLRLLAPPGSSSPKSWRSLSPDASSSRYVALVAPGEHTLVIRGPDLADVYERFQVSSGERVRLRSSLQRGVARTLRFHSTHANNGASFGSRALMPAEEIELEAWTANGVVRQWLGGQNLRMVPGGFDIDVRIPADTRELRARTRLDACSPDHRGREGKRVLSPEELSQASAPIEIQLGYP